MSKDQVLGIILLLSALVILCIYGYLIYVPEFRLLAITIVATVAVIGVLGIMAWIGWTMATTPPPTPLEAIPNVDDGKVTKDANESLESEG